MTVESMLFMNAQVVTPQGIINNSSIVVSGGIIQAIDDSKDLDYELYTEVINLNGMYVVPGFIDVHVHGGGGYDVMSGSAEALDGLSCYVASKGVTSFLATTVTADRMTTERVISESAATIMRGTTGATIVGIHLEGPFLNKSRCGAQNPDHIRIGTVEELENYIELAQGHIRLLTIAPEVEEHYNVIRSAVSHHITVSIGHSDATSECVSKAIECGATHVTHLFNGMRGLHHREPGVVGAALIYDSLAVELICDGIHVNRDLISYVFRTKPEDKVILITDAMSAAGCEDGSYLLGDLPVKLSNGSVRLIEDNSLAGSVLSMDQALRNAIEYTGKDLAYIIPAMTINPAKQIGIHKRKGSIEIGKDADLVILDKNLSVEATFVKGICVYQR